MNKLVFTLIVFLVYILPAQTQNTLKGNIQDESGEGLFLTNVRVLTKDSAFVNGGVADDKGFFEVKNIKTGKYILAVSNIGYVSQCIDFEMPEGDFILPLVILKTDVFSLNEIVVKASTFIRKKDYLLVIPDKQQIKHAFSGYDLLYNLMIPGLTVDRRNKTVETVMGNATLYINGVKADFREVQNLRPKDIERVEYHSMPTGKYAGDAASINYITKTHKAGGYVTLEAEQNIGYLKGIYDVAAKMTHNNTNLMFFGGYNTEEYDGVKKEKSEELFLSDYTVNRGRTTDDADFSNNRQYSQLRVSNNNEKRDLAAHVSLIRNATPHDDRKEMLNYTGYNEQRIPSDENIDNESLRPTLNLSGTFRPTRKQQLRFELDGSYAKNKYSRNYTEDEQYSFTRADEDFYSFYVYGQYMYQPDSVNTFAASLSQNHNVTSADYSGDYSSWQHLWNNETHLYLTYIRELGKKATFYFNPGLSLLNYKLHGDKLHRSWTACLNTWVRYQINFQHMVAIGFSSGIFQPRISYLNSMDQTIDFYQLKRGNPNLDNIFLSNWLFMYDARIQPFNVQLRLSHDKYKHNVFTDYYLEGNKLISSYSSEGSFNTANTDLSISCRISDHLRTNLGLKYKYMYVPEKSGLNQSNFAASFDVNYFVKAFTFNAYIKTQEKLLSKSTLAYIKTPASYGLSVRYNNKNFMFEAGTENPFTKQVHYREYADYGVYKYDQIHTGRIYQQTGFIKLAYIFDFGKKTSREGINMDKSINSGILKIE